MSSPRILLMDDNVRDIGGHYLELASLLADGARELGYAPQLVTNRSLLTRNPDALSDPRLVGVPVDARFQVRRMENWSLGVDGPSRLPRDLDAKPTGGTAATRLIQTICDYACRPQRRPAAMLNSWADDFVAAVQEFDPGPQDQIVVNTGGDFQMLALAAAINRLDEQTQPGPLSIHVIFHFAVFESRPTERAQAFGQQISAALNQIGEHAVHIHATTESLAHQLAAVAVTANPIPYPTRIYPSHNQSVKSPRRKIVLAGVPRAEKGRDEIKRLLSSLESSELRSGRYQWSMQLGPKRWQRMIPDSMHDLYQQATQTNDDDSALQILQGNLNSRDYHLWLDSADIGLFLYDPQRYVARCSGVLLEMMIRGVPVIVPQGCWLADQVDAAGRRNPIGWIYQSPAQIPEILKAVDQQWEQVASNCQLHGQRLKSIHSGQNTLRQMGIPDASPVSRRVAG
ncbi:hypothetical protein NHH03_19250 [Stieleria sp. TO1_6]|uniref:hypothetical protein n=1 Tax=Stieleria tagensis TaxID=2956795 RepID=UPI00209B750F|nr:hypothetical protein [Stieleria tagensis]MCO8123891.1 hypothetical protein [Stieleria tagensis]